LTASLTARTCCSSDLRAMLPSSDINDDRLLFSNSGNDHLGFVQRMNANSFSIVARCSKRLEV
jgi:hypothetical protein